MDLVGFIDDVKNKIVAEKDEKAPTIIIDENMAKRAYDYILKESVNNDSEALMLFASGNLLNAYVKDKNAAPEFRKNYYFKSVLAKHIYNLAIRPIKNVSVANNARANCTYASVGSLQFSFHSLFDYKKLKEKDDKTLQTVTWEGIRLQPHAGFIFNETEKYLSSLKEKKPS